MQNRVPAATLQADKDTLSALEALTDYAPRNAKYTVSTATAARDRNDAARSRVIRAKAELAAALDEDRDSGIAFHDIITEAKDEVKVQYGANSDQYASLGRKKKNERKRPARRTSSDAKTTP
jgi:hypothetical protein